MNKYKQRPMRHALAVLTAGLVLGGLVAANAQNPVVFPTNVYYMSGSVPTGTLAPYSAGGGVPAQALIATPVQTSTNWSISWYGMRGWSTIQGSADLVNWVNLTNVAATNYAWTTTITNPLGGADNFRLSQNNTYVGQATCSGCHADKYNGWTNTAHSQATAALLNPNGTFSSAFANPSCLVCHTVGDGQPTGYVYATNSASYSSVLANVGCEDCHGPAGWHDASEKDMITPAVSMDPAICGSCHQGFNPQYNEYATTVHAQPTTSAATSFSCAPCHQANNRMAMVAEYADRLAGNPHPLTPFSSKDATAWTVACANCHDPHGVTASPVFGSVTTIVPGVSTNVAWTVVSSNNVQMWNPLWSSNFYTMPALADGNLNTTFDAYYNPNINICGQCHNTRGARWDGLAYGLITNTVVSNYVTQAGYYPQITYVTNAQVFTNLTYNYTYTNGVSVGVTNIVMITNSYVLPYATNQVWMAGGTYSVTNSTHTAGLTTNVSFSRGPHLSPQYNMLIGILQPDYLNTTNGSTIYTNGILNNGIGIYATHSGLKPTHGTTVNTNQCATCHVPSYTTAAGNVTGHTFQLDPNGCALGGCHTTGAPDYPDYRIENTNLITSVVDLLNRWATNNAPAIFPTHYGTYGLNCWEYTTAGALGLPGVAGPSASDQLLLPTAIQQARFDVYEVANDGSLGVHNPTFIPLLLKDAETKILSQFAEAMFTAKATYAATNVNITFTNLSPGLSSATWYFGDGGTTNTTAATVNHWYTNAGPYTVSLTASGINGTETLTRNGYINIYVLPTPSFNYTTGTPTGSGAVTVTFTNTSPNGNYGSWSYYDSSGIISASHLLLSFACPPSWPNSYTYPSAGTYPVILKASSPGGSVSITNNVIVP